MKNNNLSNLIAKCDGILKRNYTKGSVYAQWSGDAEGNEYICVVFNDKTSIYIHVEEVENKLKVIGNSGDNIAGGSWYDLEKDEVEEYAIFIEELLNR